MKIKTTWDLGVGATNEQILAAKVEYYQQFEKVAQAQQREIARLRQQLCDAERVMSRFLNDDWHLERGGSATEPLRRLRMTIRAYEKRTNRRIYPYDIYPPWCDYRNKVTA